jgi:hypothetical protein
MASEFAGNESGRESRRTGVIVAARLSRDDVAASLVVRQPVVPSLRRATIAGRASYSTLPSEKNFCHPAGKIFVRRPDAR